MSRRWQWLGGIGVGIVSYLVALAVTIPAGFAWSYAGDRVRGQLHRPLGTIQQGSAQAFSAGSLVMREPRWSWQPGALLAGGLSWSVAGRLSGGQIDAEVGYGLDGLMVRDIRGQASAAELLRVLAMSATADAVAGRVELAFDELWLRHGRPVGAIGMIRWRDAQVGPNQRLALGDVHLSLKPQSGQDAVKGELEARGGAIEFNGDLRLAADGRFELTLNMLDGAENDAVGRQLHRLLETASSPGEPLAIRGRLGPDGLSLE